MELVILKSQNLQITSKKTNDICKDMSNTQSPDNVFNESGLFAKNMIIA